jgi:hypothetical protein
MLAGKKLGTLLVLSSMANAFLAGSLVTHFMRGHRRPDHHAERRAGEPGRRGPGGPRWDGAPEGRLLHDLVDALGGPRDARVRAALGQGRARMTAHRTRLERAQAGVRSALGAEPYDQSRVTAALAELNRELEARQQEAQTTLIALGAQLTAEERSQLRLAPPRPRRP